MVVIDMLPGLTAIIRPPEPFICRLDEGIDTIRMARCHSHCNLTHLGFWQSLTSQALPCRAAIPRHIKATARTSAPPPPSPYKHLPHAGKKNARIIGVHSTIGTAGVLIDKKDSLPGLPPIHCAKNSPFLLRTITMTHCRSKYNIRVFWMDDNPAYPAGLLKTHVLPCFTSIRRFIDTYPLRNVTADEGFTRSCPDYIGI